MRCKQCSNELPNDAKFCMNCGWKVEVDKPKQNKSSLAGKVYNFYSAVGGRGWFLSVFNSRVYSTVTVEDNSLHITTEPNRFTKLSFIPLDNIDKVSVSPHINFYNLCLILLSIVAGFVVHWAWFLGALIDLWIGMDRKIKICTKLGAKKIVLYSKDKGAAMNFRYDIMQQVNANSSNVKYTYMKSSDSNSSFAISEDVKSFLIAGGVIGAVVLGGVCISRWKDIGQAGTSVMNNSTVVSATQSYTQSQTQPATTYQKTTQSLNKDDIMAYYEGNWQIDGIDIDIYQNAGEWYMSCTYFPRADGSVVFWYEEPVELKPDNTLYMKFEEEGGWENSGEVQASYERETGMLYVVIESTKGDGAPGWAFPSTAGYAMKFVDAPMTDFLDYTNIVYNQNQQWASYSYDGTEKYILTIQDGTVCATALVNEETVYTSVFWLYEENGNICFDIQYGGTDYGTVYLDLYEYGDTLKLDTEWVTMQSNYDGTMYYELVYNNLFRQVYSPEPREEIPTASVNRARMEQYLGDWVFYDDGKVIEIEISQNGFSYNFECGIQDEYGYYEESHIDFIFCELEANEDGTLTGSYMSGYRGGHMGEIQLEYEETYGGMFLDITGSLQFDAYCLRRYDVSATELLDYLQRTCEDDTYVWSKNIYGSGTSYEVEVIDGIFYLYVDDGLDLITYRFDIYTDYYTDYDGRLYIELHDINGQYGGGRAYLDVYYTGESIGLYMDYEQYTTVWSGEHEALYNAIYWHVLNH